MFWSVGELGSAGNPTRSWYGSVGEELVEHARSPVFHLQH